MRLPRWARINVDTEDGPYKKQKNNNASSSNEKSSGNNNNNNKKRKLYRDVGEEELYLRSASYYYVEGMIDGALRQSLDLHPHNKNSEKKKEQLLRDIVSFLSKFQPINYEDGEGQRPRCTEKDLLISHQFHPTILPIAILQSTPSFIDRREIVHSIQRALICLKHNNKKKMNKKAKQEQQQSKDSQHEMFDEKEKDDKDAAKMTPAVCLIRNGPVRSTGSGASGGGTLNNQIRPRNHGDLMSEILMQCIAQETNPSQYTYLLERRKKRKKQHKKTATTNTNIINNNNNDRPTFYASVPLSCTESIIEWASLTEDFNSIVVLIENPETIPAPTLDMLLGIMTNLRSTHGLPISLVMISFREAESLSYLKRSSIYGESGTIVKEFDCLSPNQVFDQLMEQLDENINFPILLGGKILPRLRECFVDNHLSTVATTQEMKKVIAHHFARSGTYLSLFQCEGFVKCHWQRLAWLCLDSRSKIPIHGGDNIVVTGKMLHSWLRSEDTLRCILPLMLRVIQKAFFHVSSPRVSRQKNAEEFSFKAYTLETTKFEAVARSVFECILEAPPRKNIEFLAYWCQELEQFLSQNKMIHEKGSILFDKLDDRILASNSFLKALKRGADELTVLFEKIETDTFHENRAAIIQDLNKSLARWVYEGLLVILNPYKSIDKTSPLTSVVSLRCQTDSYEKIFEKSIRAEPRRSIATALSDPENEDLSFICDPCTEFLTLKGRTTYMSEWFKDFQALQTSTSSNVEDRKQRENFDFGIYQLIHCGIVSKMSISHKNDEMFERVSMVWTSGQ